MLERIIIINNYKEANGFLLKIKVIYIRRIWKKIEYEWNEHLKNEKLLELVKKYDTKQLTRNL